MQIKKDLLEKARVELKKRVLFFNIRNGNIRSLAYREYCFKKLKRKFKKCLIKKYSYDKKLEFSNKVWIIWLQGIDKTPELVKRCIESVEENFKDKEIIVIDENNFNKYVDIPDYIIEKWKKGIISYTHFSDILRISLLIAEGGLYIDATVFMTDRPKMKLDKEASLFVYQNVSLYRKERLSVVASSWLIYSCKENNILLLTRDLLFEYWKKYSRLINYNLVHLFFTMACEVYEKEWKKVPVYSNIPPHILQFELLEKYNKTRLEQIKSMSCFHKLNRRITNDIEGTFYDYIIKKGK